MKKRNNEKDSEASSNCCLAQCLQPILCSCYSCMAWLLTKVFLAVLTCFLVYYGFLTILQRREPREAFTMAFNDIVSMFVPSDSSKRP